MVCRLILMYYHAAYANDMETRTPTTGYVFTSANCPVTWSSQRQELVTLSTTESEYVAAATAAKEERFCRNFISFGRFTNICVSFCFKDSNSS